MLANKGYETAFFFTPAPLHFNLDHAIRKHDAKLTNKQKSCGENNVVMYLFGARNAKNTTFLRSARRSRRNLSDATNEWSAKGRRSRLEYPPRAPCSQTPSFTHPARLLLVLNPRRCAGRAKRCCAPEEEGGCGG